MIKLFFIALPLLLCGVAAAHAQQSGPASGGSAAKFLKLGIGARPAALAGAYVSVADDMNSIYYNPAGLSFMYLKNASFTHNEWLGGTRIENAGFAYPTGYGMLAASVLLLHAGNIEGRNIYGDETKDFTVYDLCMCLSYANDLTRVVKYGFNAKIFQEFLESESAFGLALDAGLIAAFDSNLRLGLSARNLGPALKFIREQEPLPSELTLGAGYLAFDEKLLLSGSVSSPSFNDSYLALGTEYRLAGDFRLRAGCSTRSGLRSVSCGLGMKLLGWLFDCSYTPSGDLDYTFDVTLTREF